MDSDGSARRRIRVVVVSAHTPELFAYVREVSNAYWRTQSAGPPQSIWDRDDLVPIGHLDWGEEHWTCLRSDGTVVMLTDDGDHPIAGHNLAIGMLMQHCLAASSYLRPPDYIGLCTMCGGSGRYRERVCGCGGLGWLGSGRWVSEADDE